ncbi:MAG: hypothetical protein IPK99_08000 [Flavobacteriales bacterium]|nr:hypothetical protein [Flavobacteriales bacterium]
MHSEIWNMGSSVTNNYAGYFDAWTSSNTARNYGVYTTASGGTTPYALYVNGARSALRTHGSRHQTPALKTNIQAADVAAAGDLLNAVELRHPEFNPSVCPQMQMPTGITGRISPELESIDA